MRLRRFTTDAARVPTGESPAALRRRARRIIEKLATRYPQPRIPLRHKDPFQLLVATILSAQCTDAMVNRVTPVLFERFKTPRDFATAKPRVLERIVKPTGFFRQKTRALIGMSRSLMERFDGRVPLTMDALVTLEGVGRKTANVVLSAKRLEPWGDRHGDFVTSRQDGSDDDGLGIVVDTHVRRLSQRLALVTTDDPVKIEQQLMQIVPREEWDGFSLRLIYFGREICTAQRPKCPTCPLNKLCPSASYRGEPPWMGKRGSREVRKRVD
ncbi:MAG: endonuclease III domain-containing protein [bacterium]